MQGIDFSNMVLRRKTYGGANGQKFQILYNNKRYMLKFPAKPKLNQDMSYANSCVSEYLGSHIFSLAGIKAQETLLGTYNANGKERIVVACKDFISSPEISIQDFTSIKNTVIDSEQLGAGTELSDIMYAIDNQNHYDPKKMKEYFWDMFIVDAFIGNWDRHNGNWGLLYNEAKDEVLGFCPVFDCGSALFPQADEKIMRQVLTSKEDMAYRVFEIPLSAIKQNGQKISYYKFISSLANKDCNAALKRIVPKLNLSAINQLIDETPYVSELQKQFYKTILSARKELILDKSLDKLLQSEKEKNPKRNFFER